MRVGIYLFVGGTILPVAHIRNETRVFAVIGGVTESWRRGRRGRRGWGRWGGRCIKIAGSRCFGGQRSGIFGWQSCGRRARRFVRAAIACNPYFDLRTIPELETGTARHETLQHQTFSGEHAYHLLTCSGSPLPSGATNSQVLVPGAKPGGKSYVSYPLTELGEYAINK